jgi:hypothetical protein
LVAVVVAVVRLPLVLRVRAAQVDQAAQDMRVVLVPLVRLATSHLLPLAPLHLLVVAVAVVPACLVLKRVVQAVMVGRAILM